jgi:competence protein ComEC
MLARRGISLVGSVKSGALVEIVADGSAASEAAAASRAFVRRAVGAAVGRWSERSAAVVTAIIIGDRAGLDDTIERRLQEAGTYHVIAISGGNIAILAGLLLTCFRAAGFLGPGAMLTAMVGLTAYGFVLGSGGGSSAERATFMAVLYFGGRAIDLRGPPLNALALAAGLLVAAEPLAVADPAFLLTFGATAGILYFLPILPKASLPRWAAPMLLIVAASIACELVLLPVGALLFSRVTFAGLLLNPAAIPLMAVTQVAGMAVIPAHAVSPALAEVPGWVAHVAVEGLIRSSDFVEIAPMLAWRVAPPSWTVVAAYYAGLATCLTLGRWPPSMLGGHDNSRRLMLRAGACVTLVTALWIVGEPGRAVAARGDGRLHITFLDVGQGDATLVRFPLGASLLVDAGGVSSRSSFDIGDRVVAPALRRAGVRRLEAVALTHGDADHIGGVPAIVREFRPRDIWEGIPVAPLEAIREIRAFGTERRARWVNLQTNDRLSIDGVAVIVRHPPIADWERQRVRNDDSMVLELVWNDVSIVLTGDISAEVERELTASFAPSRLRIVKVPHHGSLTSSSWDFLRALAPRVAVVSAGRANVFGHPVPAVLERYRAVGAEVFRTDMDGAVMVETDGRSLEVRTIWDRRYSAFSR